jgi:hypothetical protein
LLAKRLLVLEGALMAQRATMASVTTSPAILPTDAFVEFDRGTSKSITFKRKLSQLCPGERARAYPVRRFEFARQGL